MSRLDFTINPVGNPIRASIEFDSAPRFRLDRGGLVTALPDFAETTPATQVTSQNTTYNFSEQVSVGQYVTGDYFGVIPNGGNVTIASTTPASLTTSGDFEGATKTYNNETLHGLMVDPNRGSSEFGSGNHGFHSFEAGDYADTASTLQPYDPALNLDPGFTSSPLVVTQPSTIVKAINDLTPPDNMRDGMVTDMSFLTLVDSAPLENAFRPSPRSADKASYFTKSDMDLSFLPNLAAPASTPTYATLLAYLTGPFQTFFTNNLFCRNINPIGQQPVYGRDIAHDLGDAMMALCTDALTAEQKLEISTLLCQFGIDVIGTGQDGGSFGTINGSYGGGQHWIKCPAIFAAHALRNASNSAKATELAQRVDPDRFVWASEDRIHDYVDREQIESFPEQRAGYDHIDFKDYMQNAPMWNSKPSAPQFTGAAFDHVYRPVVWPGLLSQAFALMMMGIESNLTPSTIDYLEFIYDHSFSEPEKPFPNSLSTFAKDMLPAFLSTYGPNYSDAAVPALVRTVARNRYVWFEFDKLLSKEQIPAASAFAVNVNGSPVTIRSGGDVFDDLNLDFQFRSPNVYGFSMAVELVSPVAEGDTVTLSYTKPGTNNAITLGGAQVPNIGATAAINETGLLPSAATSINTVYGGGAGDSDRQFSGTNGPRPGAIDWLQLSARFEIHSRSQNDTLVCSQDLSTSRFTLYCPDAAGNNLRFFFGRSSANRVDMNGAFAALPLDTAITMHVFVDYSQADETNAVSIYFEWDGGSLEPTIASSARTPDTPDILNDVFRSGFYVGGPANDSAYRADMSHTGYILNYGLGSTPAAPMWTDPAFDWNADWGGNGENVWGEPRYYWAGPLSEWNGSIPNRGNGGTLAMTPRLIDIESEDLVTEYTVTA